MNVGMNAVQAMGEKGGRLRISTLAEDRRIVISLEDSGSGISLDAQKRMFEPFFTTKPAGKGTGLGLFITHQIVTNLGGSIHVRSEPGVGTTVVIGLPVQDRAT
jgi:signal transduction histidine kinase